MKVLVLDGYIMSSVKHEVAKNNVVDDSTSFLYVELFDKSFHIALT